MKKVIEYIPLLTICLFFFGYSNLHGYYKEFKIDIHNYISNTEILLSFLPTIVVWATLTYSLFYQMLVQEAGKTKKEPKLEDIKETDDEQEEVKQIVKNSRWKSIFKNVFTSFWFYFFSWSIIRVILGTILVKYYYSYELQWFSICYSLGVILIIYLAIFFKDDDVNYFAKNPIIVSLFIIMFINSEIISYRINDAKKLKAGIIDRNISFKYNNKIVRTYSKLLYIGQTQSSLFLYNRNNKATLIYKTSEIDSLIVNEASLQYANK
ncbi:MAG: hypothetical protein V4565_05095 [Bacteroidota bacterium]